MSTEDRRSSLAVDVDAAWFGWSGEDRGVRVADFSDHEPVISRLDGIEADEVTVGFLPGTFLLRDGARVVRWNVEGARVSDPVEVPEGTWQLMDLAASNGRAHRYTLLAATGRELYGYRDGIWDPIAGLRAPTLLLAWQHRRRSVLLLTEDGTVSRFDPVAGEIDLVAQEALDDVAAPACYDEVLGGIWVTSASRPATVRFLRVEPWPPKKIYSVDLDIPPHTLQCSHSGEWLIVQGEGPGSALLYNINGHRSFRAPTAVSRDSWPAAFTYANQLVAVSDDDCEVTEIPARADVRAPGASLDIDTLWENPPRMHRLPPRQVR